MSRAGGRGVGPAGGRGMPAPRAGGRGPAPPQGGDGLLPTRMAVPTGDFNFEAAFAKFSKEDFANQQAPGPVATYVKDDFFDSMSCDALERAAVAAAQNAPQGRSRFHEQRKLDMDTFGAAGGVRRVDQMTQGGGRGGRGDAGRGGRGDAGRGRGDGGRGRGGGRTVSHGFQSATGRGGRGGRGDRG